MAVTTIKLPLEAFTDRAVTAKNLSPEEAKAFIALLKEEGEFQAALDAAMETLPGVGCHSCVNALWCELTGDECDYCY